MVTSGKFLLASCSTNVMTYGPPAGPETLTLPAPMLVICSRIASTLFGPRSFDDTAKEAIGADVTGVAVGEVRNVMVNVPTGLPFRFVICCDSLPAWNKRPL